MTQNFFAKLFWLSIASILLMTGCVMDKRDYSENLKELSLYVVVKFNPKRVRWKLVTIPEESQDRSSIPGPIFYESMIIVFELNPEDIEKFGKSLTSSHQENLLPLPPEFIKPWIPPAIIEKLRQQKMDSSFFDSKDFIGIKTDSLGSFAVLDKSTVTVYINYQKNQ